MFAHEDRPETKGLADKIPHFPPPHAAHTPRSGSSGNFGEKMRYRMSELFPKKS